MATQHERKLNRERQHRAIEREKSAGIVRVLVKVPRGRAAEIKEIAARMCDDAVT